MIDLFFFCLILSLKITAVYKCFQPGNVFFSLRNHIASLLYDTSLRIIEKPLYDCLPCMASIWGTIFYFLSVKNNYNFIEVIIIVCGMLSVIEHFLTEDLI